MTNLLVAEHLHAHYGRGNVLSDLDFAIDEGSVSVFLGANGAGKSTLLRSISGMTLTSGSLKFLGMEISGKPASAIARLGIAHVPEGRGTFANLTVAENLEIGGHRLSSRIERTIQRHALLEDFPPIKALLDRKAGTLSGGEQQMLAIARALMMKPRLLLLDEPSFGLAPKIVENLFGLLRRILTRGDTTIVLVEQAASYALDLADKVYVLEAGQIAATGFAKEFQDNPKLLNHYLGI
jgi:branched-chain amino acid transport system ATP-binding protein